MTQPEHTEKADVHAAAAAACVQRIPDTVTLCHSKWGALGSHKEFHGATKGFITFHTTNDNVVRAGAWEGRTVGEGL